MTKVGRGCSQRDVIETNSAWSGLALALDESVVVLDTIKCAPAKIYVSNIV